MEVSYFVFLVADIVIINNPYFGLLYVYPTCKLIVVAKMVLWFIEFCKTVILLVLVETVDVNVLNYPCISELTLDKYPKIVLDNPFKVPDIVTLSLNIVLFVDEL